jgi:peptidyl-tRNA hydrolase, PTH1 family
MKLILGLGNPGVAYQTTRHNLGAKAVSAAALELKVKLTRHSFESLWGKGQTPQGPFILALPMTYMNCSGRAAAKFSRYHHVPPSDILAVVDDFNLGLGQCRFRAEGSAGGHNGLKSLIEELQTDQFHRLRLGVGSAPASQSITDYVLGNFSSEEKDQVDILVPKAAKAILRWLEAGIQPAMREFNT